LAQNVPIARFVPSIMVIILGLMHEWTRMIRVV